MAEKERERKAGMPEAEESAPPPAKRPRIPPAGPHDRPDLTDDLATPGAGTLPPSDPDENERDADSASG